MNDSRLSALARLRQVARKSLLWGGYGALGVFVFVALLTLTGRYLVLPEISNQRHVIEKKLAEAMGLDVRIGDLTATWPALHPVLEIGELQVHDRMGRVALSFERVRAEIGWSSLWNMDLRLHRLEIDTPAIDIRRDSTGIFHIAGLPLQGEGNGSFAKWLHDQGRIVVRDAQVQWHDELRGAPPLSLEHLNFELINGLIHHRFGLTAVPPENVARKIDIRADLVGDPEKDLADWHGELYADLEQVDLSTLTPWVDMPFEWSQGKGGLRLWLSFADLRPKKVTAELRMADVSLRLQRDLPPLALKYLHGRVIGEQRDNTYIGEIKRMELATHDGIELPPVDARLQMNLGRQPGGEFRTNLLDFGALAAVASHLPLPTEIHDKLRSFAPQGRLSDLDLSWQGPVETPQRWRIKGNFAGLALAAYRELPGFTGISGHFSGDEQAGSVIVDSSAASIELPAVFAEPTLALARLYAETGWRAHKGGDGLEIVLKRVNFQNDDATGEASGSYRYTGQGLGEIDLSAKLTNAAGSAVWRYMPLVVNKDARDWLRTAITGGQADQASLRLKGPLDEFPFPGNRGGIFQVKGSFQGATLKYAPSWPEMTAIDGELLFEGVRMLIRGQRGDIMGVALSDVQAEIADLSMMEELLTVSGKAKGATPQFLEFIEASPVGAQIDHFTQPMQAVGRGDLDLKLVLPLRQLDKTQVQGRYRFADNQLRVLPELPVFTKVQGELGFTSERLQAKGLRGRFLGMPLTADVSSAAGGVVRVNAQGTLNAALLRQELGFPGLEHLSGDAPWKGSVVVKKPGAEIQIESSLEGVASSLPDPLNKSQREALPLKVEGRIDTQHNEWSATLGGQAAGRLLQQGELWRGRLALGAAAVKAPLPPLPTRGMVLSVGQGKLDGDAWRAVLNKPELTEPAAARTSFQLVGMDVKTAELNLLGRGFHDVQLSGQRVEDRWRLSLNSREAQGQLQWDGSGAGRISGRMAQLTVPAADKVAPPSEASSISAPQPPAAEPLREMPAVDLVIDQFRIGDMALGEVRLGAENRAGVWQAKLDVKNEAAKLSGEGRWRPSRTAPETQLNFKLDVNDAEKLLTRMGMPDAVRRGAAQIEGNLTWAGVPFGFDLPTLSGKLKLDAEKGQFKKLEPGVGRLLGVLSLQSLPRRITLDFRDVFSEGFAFDSITGDAVIQRGVVRTDELSIRGPAAKVLLSGQANLVAETQDLKVRVQPALGESIAVGAMIANPVAGAVAWAAQKVLNDPLDQVFAYEFAVTGGWADPKVEKLNRFAPETPRSSP